MPASTALTSIVKFCDWAEARESVDSATAITLRLNMVEDDVRRRQEESARLGRRNEGLLDSTMRNQRRQGNRCAKRDETSERFSNQDRLLGKSGLVKGGDELFGEDSEKKVWLGF